VQTKTSIGQLFKTDFSYLFQSTKIVNTAVQQEDMDLGVE